MDGWTWERGRSGSVPLDNVAAMLAAVHVLPDKMNAFAKMGQDSRVW
jgi:hypothetical protein